MTTKAPAARKASKPSKARAKGVKPERSAETELRECFESGGLSEADFRDQMDKLIAKGRATGDGDIPDADAAPAQASSDTPAAKPTEEPESEAILEISTLAPEREQLAIDGTMYELKLLSEWGVAGQHRVKREIEEYDTLWKKSTLTGREEKRLKFLLDTLTEKVLMAPAEVKARLNDEARQQVVLGFTLAPLVKEAARQMREQEAQETPEARVGSTSET